MSNCPYCNGAHLSATDRCDRKRPATHTTVQCASCMAFAVKHEGGRIFPLRRREDPNEDPVQRVVD